jgi:hypothetical protein
MMRQTNDAYNRSVLLGCVGFGLLSVLIFVALMGVAVNKDRQRVRYPGSIPMTAHSNYSALPRQFRWDNSYRTSDPFPAVYEWYSITFGLGAEARALGGCILLEGSDKQFAWKRHTSVVVCDTPGERQIFITRSTSVATPLR